MNEIEQTCSDICFWIGILYFVAVLFWVFLLWILGVKLNNIVVGLITLIPLLVFAISYSNVGKESLTPRQEGWIFRNNYENLVIMIIYPILIWCASQVDRKAEFFKLVVTATALTLLSMVDLWTSSHWFIVVKHLRSILQTYSICLVLIALKLFYDDQIATKDDDDYSWIDRIQ
jgi:hypothetical protein